MSDFEGLLPKVFKGEATADEQKRFWDLARNTGVVDERLRLEEAAVRVAPTDIPAKLDLAQTYIAKLFTVPPGPEMGVWGAKAETQWKDSLRLDDRNWEARFRLADSYLHYPEFLNKTPDSIREFETLRRQQEASSQEPRFSQTYVKLSLLYRRQGDPQKAREVLDAGALRFPADEEIRKSLDAAR